MVRRSPNKSKTDQSNQVQEITRIACLVEEMQKNFSSQKQELEQKISRLENQIGQEPKNRPNPSKPVTSQPSSRRRMLKQLGIAATGLAVAGVAAGLGSETPASAASTALLISTDTSTTSNPESGPTTLSTPPTGPTFTALSISNNNTTSGDALYVSSTMGVALNALSSGPNSAIIGIQGNITTATQTKAAPSGVVGGSGTNTSYGVSGLSDGSVGIYGYSNGSYGGVFEKGTGGISQMQLVPASSTGAPTTGSHATGELFLDSGGHLWLCTAGGASSPSPMTASQLQKRMPGATPSDFQRIQAGVAPIFVQLDRTSSSGVSGIVSPVGNGSSTTSTGTVSLAAGANVSLSTANNVVTISAVGSGSGGASFLNTPQRLIGAGTPVVLQKGSTTYYPMTIGGGAAGSLVPANAQALLASVSVIYPSASGYLTIFAGDISTAPLVATIGYQGGGFVFTTAVTVRLGNLIAGQPGAGTPGIGVFCYDGPVKMAFDVFGYFL